MIVIVAFIDLFAHLLLGNSMYFQALEIVPVILLANLFLGIYYNLSVWFKLTDKTRYGMYFSILGAIITVGLNIIYIPKIGYMASAWATLITYVFIAMLSYLYGKKYYEIPYSLKINALTLLLTSAGSYLSFIYFRGNYVVSVLIILAFVGIVLWTQKSEIKQIWKT